VATGGVVGLLGEVTPTVVATEVGTWETAAMTEPGAGVIVSTSEVPLDGLTWLRITMRAPTKMMARTIRPRAT
jgi:hypothetical protein